MVILDRVVAVKPLEEVDSHVERIYLSSSELKKKVLRKITSSGQEIGIRLQDECHLQEGAILGDLSGCCVVVEVLPEEVLAIRGRSMKEMGEIGFFIGNLHCPAFIDETEFVIPYDSVHEQRLQKAGYIVERQMRKMPYGYRQLCHHH